MSLEPLFPVEDQLRGLPGSVNVDLSHPGRVAPAFDHAPLTGNADVLHYFGASFIETLDENNLPVTFVFANKTVWKIQNGTISVDNTFTTGGVIQDICMVTRQTESGGVYTQARILVAVFGPAGPVSTGTATGNAERNMTTGAWTNNEGATYLTAYFLKTNSDQLGAATGTTSTGRTATVERKFAIASLGSNPVLAASYSTGEAVWNDATWQINNIAAFEDRWCIGGPLGFFIRDQQEGRWKNMTQHVRPHGVNGKVTMPGENCVWYATQKELWRFDGREMEDVTPFKGMEKPRDMPQGRVSALVDNGDRVIVALECWDDQLAGVQAKDAGIRIFKETGVTPTITELTANALDDDMGTTADMTDWGNTTTDYLVFGSPRKLSTLGIRTLLVATANDATQSFTAPQALNGAGTWTTLGSIRDATILSIASRSMQVTGFPASSGESVIGWTNIDAFDTPGLDTYNSISGLYWYRVASATAAGFSPTTGSVAGFQEAFVVPGRPGLPNTGLLSSSTNFSSLFRGGGITRILEAKRSGSRLPWEDKYHLNTGGGVFCIGHTASPTAPGSNGGRGLLLLGRFKQMYVMEGRTGDVTQHVYPRLAQITSSEPGPMLAVYNKQFGDVRTLSKVNKIMANGVFVQEDDAIQCIVQLDEWKVFDLGVRYGTHAKWEVDPKTLGPFWRCHFFFMLKDTNQPGQKPTAPDPAGPYWTNFLVDVEDTGVPYESLYQAKSFPTGAEIV